MAHKRAFFSSFLLGLCECRHSPRLRQTLHNSCSVIPVSADLYLYDVCDAAVRAVAWTFLSKRGWLVGTPPVAWTFLSKRGWWLGRLVAWTFLSKHALPAGT